MHVRKDLPIELIAFATLHDATITNTTKYFYDSEATQYPELKQWMPENEEGLTFKGGYSSLTNADSVDRHEVVELVAILQRHDVKLTSLLINGGYIDDKGVRALADYIQTSKSLKVLDIHYSHVSALGMQCIIDVLKVNTSLIQINIRSNTLTPVLFQNLMELFQQNHSSILQIGIVQRSSFPGEWKPSVEDEQSLHELIIENARNRVRKKASRQLICGIKRLASNGLPYEVGYQIAMCSMFSQFPAMAEKMIKENLKKAEDDYQMRFESIK
jgi:hypothetical protein